MAIRTDYTINGYTINNAYVMINQLRYGNWKHTNVSAEDSKIPEDERPKARIDFYVLVYPTKALRQQGQKPIYEFEVNNISVTPGADLLAEAYKHIKTLDEFSESEDA